MTTFQMHKCPEQGCGYGWRTEGPEGSAVHLSPCPRCHPSMEMTKAATDLAESLVYMLVAIERRMAAGKIAHDIELQMLLRRGHDALTRAGVRP
jgi:hypothetical protein